MLHGVPRATFDLDLLIDASPDNARRLIDALLAAGLGTAALTSADEILANEITVFKDRVRIDIQTSTPGLSFADAWAHRLSMNYQGQPFHIVSREDLILGETRGRPVDLEDVRLLEARSDDKDQIISAPASRLAGSNFRFQLLEPVPHDDNLPPFAHAPSGIMRVLLGRRRPAPHRERFDAVHASEQTAIRVKASTCCARQALSPES